MEESELLRGKRVGINRSPPLRQLCQTASQGLRQDPPLAGGGRFLKTVREADIL